MGEFMVHHLEIAWKYSFPALTPDQMIYPLQNESPYDLDKYLFLQTIYVNSKS